MIFLTAVFCYDCVWHLVNSVNRKSEILPPAALRWFSPELHGFVRMTTVVHQGCWNATGHHSWKPGWTAPFRATPSSTLMFCSHWQMSCRSTTAQLCLVSSPHRPTGWDHCSCPSNWIVPQFPWSSSFVWSWQLWLQSSISHQIIKPFFIDLYQIKE